MTKKSTVLKILVRFFLILLCVSILGVALLPSLISSSWGKEKLTAWTNRSIPGKIRVDNLSITWFGPQTIQGFSLSDPHNETILSLESASSNTSLFRILSRSMNFGSFEFKALNAIIIGDNEGNTNLMQALDKRCCEMKSKPDIAPITIALRNTHGYVNLSPAEGPIAIQLQGETEQNALRGKFDIEAEIKGMSLSEMINSKQDLADTLLSLPEAELKINANVVNFPVELLDQVISTKSPKLSGVLTEVLGDKINLVIDQKGTVKGFSFNISANSPTLTADAVILLDKELSLAKPALMTLKISPSAAEKLVNLVNLKSPWHLAAPATAAISINSLQIPLEALKSSPFEINAFGLVGALDIGQAVLIGKDLSENLTINKFHATTATETNSQLALITVSSEVSQKEQPTKINFTLSVPKKAFVQDLYKISLKEISLRGNIEAAPLFALDKLTAWLFLPSELLGSHADLDFFFETQDDKTLASVQYKSEQFEIPRLAFWISDHITLQQPAQIIFKINQSLVNLALQNSSAQIQGPATAQLTLNTLSFPAAHLYSISSPLSMMYHLKLDAQLKMTSVSLANVADIGGFRLNDFSVRLSADPKMHPELIASFSLQPDAQSALSHIIGNKASFKTAASLGRGINGKLSANVFNLQVVSDIARLDLSGEIREGSHLILSSPAMLSYTFTAAGLQTMGVAADAYLFKHGAPLEMTIDSLHIPLSLKDLSMLKMSGKLKITDFQLMQKVQQDRSLAVIDNINASWSIDGSEKLITAHFSGITRLGENQAAGKINGLVAINEWMKNGALDFNQASMNLNVSANKLPVELVSALSGEYDLVPILGNALDLSFEANASLASSEEGTLSIDINSENMSGSLDLMLGDIIRLNPKRPAEFTLKLTPQGYSSFRRRINKNDAGNFTLAETAIAKLKLHSLSLPRSQSFIQSGIEVDFSVDSLIGLDARTQNTIALQSVQGHLVSKNLVQNIDFNLNAKGYNQESGPTGWNMSGSLEKGFLSDGSINREDLSLTFNATIEALPLPLLCQFICLDPGLKQKIEALLGQKINAAIKARLQRMNGPVYADVKGQNGRFLVDGYLNEGTMTLNQDLTAQIAVSPELSEYVFRDLIPVLNGMLSADHPISLTIGKDGFSLPLRNPSATTITFRQASLEMGKVRFSGQSQIAKVLSLLTPDASDLQVWLTPAYFSLNQGFLKLERVDMLISDRYPIIAWGDVDMGKDRVNMVIGLTGAAISKAFSVPGIGNSYVLQLPLKGRLNNPSIDKTRAVARLSALVAHNQGGPHGAVIGTVLDIATGGLTEGHVPPPTTNPLPWSNLLKDADVREQYPKHDHRESKPKSIEDIGKEASTVIKKFFK